jgi:hypothetical protein
MSAQPSVKGRLTQVKVLGDGEGKGRGVICLREQKEKEVEHLGLILTLVEFCIWRTAF